MNGFFLNGLVAAALAAASPAFAQPAALPAPQPDAPAARMATDIQMLSSDAFQGREPATPAEPRTVDYIVGQMQAAGLKPAGDPGPAGRAWTQAVPLARFQITGPVTAGAHAGGKSFAYAQGEQIAIRAAQTGASRVAIENAPIVFVGYGVKAPERNWDDFKGYDLKGKIALVLVNDPDFETGAGDFGGKAMTYYGRWTYKYEEAARQGAVGCIIVHETGPASYGWNTVKNSNDSAVFDIIRKDPAKAHAPLEAWIQRDAAVQLLQAAGLDFEALKKAAQSRDFRPVPLPGAGFSADFAVSAEKVVTHNVAGELPGKGHAGERIIYTAHWDHLCVGQPDARGDRIYNGAVDNGTGVAALLELARDFSHAPRTDRTVTFLSVTAEEKGLLGSAYYAQSPLYPLATTVAVLNMDALGVNGPARDFTVAGDGALTLQDDLIETARRHGKAFTPDPEPEAGHFFRSDHFSFAKAGVPAVSYGSGEDLAKGGKAAGLAVREAYVRDRYHQPADEYDPAWDLGGLAEDVSVLYDLGRRLADSREWPQWKPGSEFKAARDASALQRR